jgi:hypothetical protein
MTIDWKKVGMWSGIAGVAGVVGYWLYQYQQTAAANSASQAATDSQNENQALAALMTESSTDNGGSTVSGPTVDTGSTSLQALIASILNPPAATTTSTTPVTTTPSTPVTTTPSTPIDTNTSSPVSAPVGSGANPIQAPNSDATQVSISPAILYTIPVATGTQ